MLRLNIIDSHNQTDGNDFLIEAKKNGTYAEPVGLKTLYALNCDPSKGRFSDLIINPFISFLFNRIL